MLQRNPTAAIVCNITKYMKEIAQFACDVQFHFFLKVIYLININNFIYHFIKLKAFIFIFSINYNKFVFISLSFFILNK